MTDPSLICSQFATEIFSFSFTDSTPSFISILFRTLEIQYRYDDILRNSERRGQGKQRAA